MVQKDNQLSTILNCLEGLDKDMMKKADVIIEQEYQSLRRALRAFETESAQGSTIYGLNKDYRPVLRSLREGTSDETGNIPVRSDAAVRGEIIEKLRTRLAEIPVPENVCKKIESFFRKAKSSPGLVL